MQNAAFMNDLIHVRNENFFELYLIIFDRSAIAICTHEFKLCFWYGFAHRTVLHKNRRSEIGQL